jgi:hypothetical protein
MLRKRSAGAQGSGRSQQDRSRDNRPSERTRHPHRSCSRRPPGS